MIKVHFDKLYNCIRENEPVTVSIPFRRGELTDENIHQFYVKDGDDVNPVQARALSYYNDKSIKFLLCRFLVNLPASRSKDVYIGFCNDIDEYNNLFVNKDTLFEYRIVCREVADTIQIDNGPLSFTVSPDKYGLFESISFKNRLYPENAFKGPILGNQMMTNKVWKIIERGPIYTSLSCTGVFGQDKGNVTLADGTVVRSGTICEVRLEIFAGRPWINVSVTVTNANEANLKLSDFYIGYDAFTTGNYRFTTGTSNFKTKYNTSTSEPVAIRVTGEDLLKESNEHFCEVFYGTFFGDYVATGDGVAMTIYKAQQNYPKAIRVSREGLKAYIAPNYDSVIMFPGTSREQKLQILFHDEDEPIKNINSRSTMYQMPDLPMLPPEVYEESGVYVDLFVKNKNYNIEDGLIQCADNHARAFGMMNFGDNPDMHYTEQGRGGGDIVWSNNEYDYPHACMLLYMRTGIRRFYDYCITNGTHQRDVDICHFNRNPLIMGGQIAHTNGHVLNGKVMCSHQWVQGLIDCYHLTGDDRFKEAAIGIGNNILKLLSTKDYNTPGALSVRENGWALRTLTSLLKETNDKKWLSKTELIINMFKTWFSTHNGLQSVYLENAEVRVPFMISVACISLMRYYQLFRRDDIKELIIVSMDDMIEHCLLDTGRFLYKDLPSLAKPSNNPIPLEALAYCYELTGDKKYLEYGLVTFRHTINGLFDSTDSSKKVIGDAMICGKKCTKQFAQTFVPVSVFYRALEKAGIDYTSI